VPLVTPALPPLVDLLQGVPAEGRAVLEDVVQGVKGAQLPPLLLVINGRRGQRGRKRRGEGGRGGREILLRVRGIPAPQRAKDERLD